jgi:hypothetical protein
MQQQSEFQFASQNRHAGSSTPAQRAVASLLTSLKIPYEENAPITNENILVCTACTRKFAFNENLERLDHGCDKKRLEFMTYFPDFRTDWRGRKILLFIDGEVHLKSKQVKKDQAQKEFFEANGYECHRIRNQTVLGDTEFVYDYFRALFGVGA